MDHDLFNANAVHVSITRCISRVRQLIATASNNILEIGQYIMELTPINTPVLRYYFEIADQTPYDVVGGAVYGWLTVSPHYTYVKMLWPIKIKFIYDSSPVRLILSIDNNYYFIQRIVNGSMLAEVLFEFAAGLATGRPIKYINRIFYTLYIDQHPPQHPIRRLLRADGTGIFLNREYLNVPQLFDAVPKKLTDCTVICSGDSM